MRRGALERLAEIRGRAATQAERVLGDRLAALAGARRVLQEVRGAESEAVRPAGALEAAARWQLWAVAQVELRTREAAAARAEARQGRAAAEGLEALLRRRTEEGRLARARRREEGTGEQEALRAWSERLARRTRQRR